MTFLYTTEGGSGNPALPTADTIGIVSMGQENGPPDYSNMVVLVHHS